MYLKSVEGQRVESSWEGEGLAERGAVTGLEQAASTQGREGSSG